MSIKFNLSYKFNKLQKIHNNQLNKMGTGNFEELLKINSQTKNVNYLDINSESNINTSLINRQLISINNQYIDDELLTNINSLSNTTNNISSIINDLYESNLNSSSSNTSNNTNTNTNTSTNTSSNNTSNTLTNKIDLSPSKIDYTSSTSDIFDKTKAKPSYEEIENWVNKYAKKYNIEPSLIMGMIKAESSFNNQCISKSGAVGLLQLMPTTAREMGLTVNSTTDERWDPEKNIEAGIAYLAKYHKIISNRLGKEDWNLTIAGYNCGPNRVIKDGKIPNIKETQNYVNKVNKYWKEFKNQ